MVLKLPAPPPCLSPKVSDIKHHDAQRRCHVIAKVEIIIFHPALPTQHFVSPMPAKTLLAAISEEGDVRIEWLEKWWCRVRERIDGTLFLARDWALSFCRSKYYALSPFASWAGGRKIVIQALVQGKLFAEKWYMFSDYKQAPPSIAKGLRCIASAFFLFNCLYELVEGHWILGYLESNILRRLESTATTRADPWAVRQGRLPASFEIRMESGWSFFGCGLGRRGWLRGIE